MTTKTIGLVSLTLLVALTAAAEQKPPVRIGVLAHRGETFARLNWQPTADYLALALPGLRIEIVPLRNETLAPVVAQGQIDFVITNPGAYVRLEARHGVTRLLTLRTLSHGTAQSEFGAVIITRANHPQVRSLADLDGRTFMGVARDAFGGFQMAWRELRHAGIDPFRDLRELKFSGEPQDRIVRAVLDGEVDAGTVRSGILEDLAAEGKIRLDEVRVLDPKRYERFPLFTSTPLYPEWAFARLRHTDAELAQKLVIALLSLPGDSAAARAAGSAGWTVPLDYTPVHELFRELRVEPYEDMARIGMQELMRQYWYWFAAVFAGVALLTLVSVYIFRINRRLKHSQERLLEIREKLEESNRVFQQLSAVDGLTGVANHRIFDEVLNKEWARALRSGAPLGLLMVDIDYFKKHNDRYGHQAGDACLKQVAAVLAETAKRPGDLVARYGGEEFAVILPGTDAAGAHVVGEQIRRAVEAVQLDYLEASAKHHVTVSVGAAAMIPARDQRPEALVAIADDALYRAKAVGRNQVILA
jgi:diguanylate cyclase (GGDEF)-like protein